MTTNLLGETVEFQTLAPNYGYQETRKGIVRAVTDDGTMIVQIIDGQLIPVNFQANVRVTCPLPIERQLPQP